MACEFLPYHPDSCRVQWLLCPSEHTVDLPLDAFISEDTAPYIHANHVSLGKGLDFIATIYPLDCALFWKMAMHKGNAVVDLTNDKDLVRNKATPYYPTSVGEEITFNRRMRVKCAAVKQLSETLTKYELLVTDLKTGESATLDRMHYTGWEDVSGTHERKLSHLIDAVEPYLGEDKVPIVHCMGGMGRTGTALAGLAMKRDYLTGTLSQRKYLRSHRNTCAGRAEMAGT